MNTSKNPRLVGVALISLSAICFGALPIFARFTYASGTEPVALLCIRFVAASAFMVAWMAQRRKRWPKGRLLMSLVLLGGVGYVGQSFSYFTALTLASASLVSLLLYLYPALVTVLAALVLKQRIDRFTTAALALALAGSALVIGVGGGGKPAGIALGLAAAFIYAIYIVIGSKVTPQAGAVASTTIVMLAAAFVFSLVALLQRPTFPGNAGGWAAALAVAGLSVVAIVSFFEALQRLGPADASTISTFEPVVTVILAWWALDETVRPIQLAGGALILIAVVMLARRDAPEDLSIAASEAPPV